MYGRGTLPARPQSCNVGMLTWIRHAGVVLAARGPLHGLSAARPIATQSHPRPIRSAHETPELRLPLPDQFRVSRGGLSQPELHRKVQQSRGPRDAGASLFGHARGVGLAFVLL